MATNKDLMTTVNADPLAIARKDSPTPGRVADALASDAFQDLSDGGTGSFDQLSEGGKQALRAFASADPGDDARYESARRAAKDAIRDHRMAGLFSAATSASLQEIVDSNDPAVRNQAPTGTQGATAGPGTAVAPHAEAPTPTHTTKGSSKP